MHLLCILNKFSEHAMGKQTCANKANPSKEQQKNLKLIVVS